MNHDYSISKLNTIYTEAESIDQDLFAEQRSNILLIAGEHYTKKTTKALTRIRDSRDLSQEQKLRIVKNHMQKITKTLRNNILQYSPGVTVVPKKPKETQDQKQAELNKSVWHDAKDKHKLKTQIADWCQDYVDIGETAVKVFWDPCAGKFKGWEAEVDENGQPSLDDSGQMIASTRPVFAGDFVFERLFGFNLLRSKDTKDMRVNGKCMIIRKMVDIPELKEKVKAAYANDPDEMEKKLKYITESQDRTYIVFDGSRAGYNRAENQTLLREYHFRPGYEFPNGYFFITTENGILFEGEHPFGVYPIAYTGWDSSQTGPRHHGIVKQLRPNQAEVNRTASKIAETQCTFDDKLLVQSGTKITNGGQLPGIRAVQYTGATPTVLEGRSGEQYLNYLNSQISEMYDLANLAEDSAPKDGPAQQDPFASLFSRIKDKKKFAIYGDKFEEFLVEVCRIFLTLAKQYYTDDMLIPAIGKNEYVNIPEFRSTNDLCYQIEIEPMTDDIEYMMGKQLVINHALQYVGSQMSKEDIGKMMRAMPLGDFDECFDDMTLDYDLSQNMILALDRGEIPEPNFYDNHKYLIKKLTSRVRMPDFKMLDQQIQQAYAQMIQVYENMEVAQQRSLIAAQAAFIPSGGARIKVDYYIQDPSNPDRTVRATLPAESVDWLIKRLSDQGSSQEQLTEMNQGAVQEMGNALLRQVPGGGGQSAPPPGANMRPSAPSPMPPQPMPPQGMAMGGAGRGPQPPMSQTGLR